MPPKGKKKFVKVVSSNKQIEQIGGNFLNELVSEENFKDALNKSKLDTSQLEDEGDVNRSMDSSGNQLTNLLAQKFKHNRSNLNQSMNKSNLEEDKSNISIHDDVLDGGTGENSKLDTSGQDEMVLNQLREGKNRLKTANNNHATTPSSAREQEINFLGLKEEINNDQYKTARNKPRKTLKEQEEDEQNYYQQKQNAQEYIEREQRQNEEFESKYSGICSSSILDYNAKIVALNELVDTITNCGALSQSILAGLDEEDTKYFQGEINQVEEKRASYKPLCEQKVKELLEQVNQSKKEALQKALEKVEEALRAWLIEGSLVEVARHAEEERAKREEEERLRREQEKKIKEEAERKKKAEQEAEQRRQEEQQRKQKQEEEERKRQEEAHQKASQLKKQQEEKEEQERRRKLEEEEEEKRKQDELEHNGFIRQIEELVEDEDRKEEVAMKKSHSEEEERMPIEQFLDQQKQAPRRNRLETVKEVNEEDQISEMRNNSEVADFYKNMGTHERLEEKFGEVEEEQSPKDNNGGGGGSFLPKLVIGVGVAAAAAFAVYKFALNK